MAMRGILNGLTCRQRYAILGNHDVLVGSEEVSDAFRQHAITLLLNWYLPT